MTFSFRKSCQTHGEQQSKYKQNEYGVVCSSNSSGKRKSIEKPGGDDKGGQDHNRNDHSNVYRRHWSFLWSPSKSLERR